jgi:EmrB/QacA subfamily drug resistance transporter
MSAQTDVTAAARGLAQEPDPKRWLALVIVVLAAFMELLDNTIINVALPSIHRNLGAGYSALQWVTTGYVLSFALLLILGGRLGDIVGRKKILLIGIAGFTTASLLCALSVSPGMLIGSRVMQGVFAGLMVPQVLSIIHVTFTDEEKTKAWGVFGGVAGLAGAVGIALSGILVSWNLFGLQWRTVFLVNVPVGIFAFVAGARIVRESKAPWKTRLDVPGVLLSILGLLLLVYPLIQGRELGWPTWTFVSMAASVPVLAVFVLYERRRAAASRSPLVALSLFRRSNFTAGLSTFLIFMMGNGIFFIAWAVYLQLGLGWSALHAGLTSLPFCAAAFPSSFTAMTVLAPKLGRYVLQLGTVIAALGLVSYAWVAGHYQGSITSWEMIIPLAIFGVGFGFLIAPIPPLAIAQAPVQDTGSASGLINTTQQLGYALGVALTTVVFFGVLGGYATHDAVTAAPQLRSALTAAHVPPGQINQITASARSCAVNQANEKNTAPPSGCANQAPLTRRPAAAAAVTQYASKTHVAAFAASFQTALWSYAGICVLAFFLLFAIPRSANMRSHG